MAPKTTKNSKNKSKVAHTRPAEGQNIATSVIDKESQSDDSLQNLVDECLATEMKQEKMDILHDVAENFSKLADVISYHSKK